MKARPGPAGGFINRLFFHSPIFFLFSSQHWKHGRESLTRFCHFWDGNILFVGHETQDGEDCKARNKTGATVQKAQRHAISVTDKHILHCFSPPWSFTSIATNAEGPPVGRNSSSFEVCMHVHYLPTCNSYYCICCSFPEQSATLNRWRRRRRSVCQHPSTPYQKDKIKTNNKPLKLKSR